MDDSQTEQIVKELKHRIHTQRQALELTYPKKDVTIEEQIQVQKQDRLSKLADSLRPRRR